MEQITSHLNFAASSHSTYVCPACMQNFQLKSAGALYGVHPTGFDDVFVTVLCNQCIDITTADPKNPDRLALKNRLEEYFKYMTAHPLYGALALTTLKVLEVHSGDIVRALIIGWPFPKAMHHYHVATTYNGGIVMVTEKEGDHDR